MYTSKYLHLLAGPYGPSTVGFVILPNGEIRSNFRKFRDLDLYLQNVTIFRCTCINVDFLVPLDKYVLPCSDFLKPKTFVKFLGDISFAEFYAYRTNDVEHIPKFYLHRMDRIQPIFTKLNIC